MYKKIDFDMFDKEADRVFRGGSCYYTAFYARAANRGGIIPGDRGGDLGLRLAFDREGQ